MNHQGNRVYIKIAFKIDDEFILWLIYCSFITSVDELTANKKISQLD